MWQEISYWGKKLAQNNLVASRFGNISVRTEKGLMIKKTGVFLDEIEGPEDVIEVSIASSRIPPEASSETTSHQAIYLATDARAIIHAHPQFAIIESLLCESEIRPLDSEGLPFLNTIPIVDGESGSKELYDALTGIFASHKVKGVVNRGHGSFAIGPDLRDCFNTTAMIEHSSKIKYFYDLAKR
ncbi:fuculose phosphate aldolase [Methanocella sp. CWC-04]|uniref:Fuculose phosphate aldolase n=2 Tax=Methanooceanicella nereidis TaxID=2052831 RepID=A0AAP2RFS9_9EURY|nr:fuculose phosphate aldolase [Methanocella sp. CWC-04]